MPKILVIEDDDNTRNALSTLLRDEGYLVELAADGATAINKVSSEVDLLLCDLNLPDGSGLDVLKSVSQKYPELAYVVMTASSSDEAYQEAASMNVAGWLTKPLDIENLLNLLKYALTEKESETC